MRIHVLQFDERVGLGTFAGWLTEAGCDITTWRCDQDQLPGVADSGPLLLLGGYMGVNDRERLSFLQQTADWLRPQVEQGRPVLAVCLGAQLLAHALGGEVTSQQRQEKGIREISLTEAGFSDPLFTGLPEPFNSFEWHNDSFTLPPGATHLARTEVCPGQAFRQGNAWGVQFHPEVDEQIVADWAARTNAGPEPLRVFLQYQQSYYQHSRRLLSNYLHLCRGRSV